MRYLITGGCGFLGSNLAREVLHRGHELFVLDNLSRVGSKQNLDWLRSCGSLTFLQDDTRNAERMSDVVHTVRPDYVFHLAGQVAMTTSLANPRADFEINALGALNILEAVRTQAKEAVVFFSSTNKVYGDLEQITYEETPSRYRATDYPNGFAEDLPLDFRSPYGCSKGCADQYMLDYARCYGLRTIVFRHSSIFGGRQFSTFDQGWVGWFVRKALEAETSAESFTINGSGKQVRDVLFASDIVNCYFSAADCVDTCAGQAFNIGGGIANSLSLLELFTLLEHELKVSLRFERLPVRQSDQKVFVADVTKAKAHFGWQPKVSALEGVREMIAWMREADESN